MRVYRNKGNQWLFCKKKINIRINPPIAVSVKNLKLSQRFHMNYFQCFQAEHTIYQIRIWEVNVSVRTVAILRIFLQENAWLTIDMGTFKELFTGIESKDPLHFPLVTKRNASICEKKEVCMKPVTVELLLLKVRLWLLGLWILTLSWPMGTVVGEKITRLFESMRLSKNCQLSYSQPLGSPVCRKES